VLAWRAVKNISRMGKKQRKCNVCCETFPEDDFLEEFKRFATTFLHVKWVNNFFLF
jgi:hypothetical protein